MIQTTQMLRLTPRSCRSRRGITLIESVVSLVVISVLMLGLSSSVMLGVRAMPTDTELGAADREVQEMLNMLRDDLAGSTALTYQKSGNTVRITLELIPTGVTGAHTHTTWDFIGDANMIRRRVDARAYEVISTDMSKYSFSSERDGSVIRYLYLQFQFDNTIQRNFELHVLTPYGPELK
jgi:prepilin-type N-terminal cleavage/methylation domain-containing protein